jgi:hypothetical protein
MKKAGIADGDSGESRELPGSSNRSFARMLSDTYLFGSVSCAAVGVSLDGQFRGPTDQLLSDTNLTPQK